MPSKYFNVHKPEQIITIVEDKDQFYQLSDGNMIKKETFMQRYQPVLEGVNESFETPTKTSGGKYNVSDPDEFFNSTTIPEDVVSGIKQVDPSKVSDVSDSTRTEVVHKIHGQVTSNSKSGDGTYNESLVKQIDDPVIPNNTNTDVSQYKVFDDEEEAYKDFERKNQPSRPQQPKPQQTEIDKEKMNIEILFEDERVAFGLEEATSRKNKRLLKLPTAQPQQQVEVDGTKSEYRDPTPQPTQLSPIEMMFSTFKRKHPITINVEFTDMIGEPDFVKLMVENMDGDIVGYYKKKVMENIMKDLSKIEKSVEETIKSEIFGDVETKPTKPVSEIVNGNVDTILVPGGTTKTGKQKYKYVDGDGNMKELLPETAKTKGYEPYKK